MWFNSSIHAKPYQFLHDLKNNKRLLLILITGAAWLSSVRIVKRVVQSCNERNPYFLLQSKV